jgi:hypothetical protein
MKTFRKIAISLALMGVVGAASISVAPSAYAGGTLVKSGCYGCGC